MKIAILTVDGVFDSGLSALLDVLHAANSLAAAESISDTPFEVHVTGLSERTRTGHGLSVDTTPVGIAAQEAEVVVIPGLAMTNADHVVTAVRGHPVLPVIERIAAEGTTLAAACSSTFLLAEAGVLDGRAATTTWWLRHQFRTRFPNVRLTAHRNVTFDHNVFTAGAAFAHIDLALALVSRVSPALATVTARHLLAGDRTTQAAMAVTPLPSTQDPVLCAFERWVREHIAEPVRIADVATRLGVSERTLQRIVSEGLGMSPLDFVHEVRLDHAVNLLRTTAMPVETIAHRVGYRNGATLRALFRRRRGVAMAGLRARSATCSRPTSS